MTSYREPAPRRRRLFGYLGVLAALALAGCMPVPAVFASQAASGGGWGRPRELPGPRAIIGTGLVTALSCTSRSACTAVGFYEGPFDTLDFAVTERNGVWGQAVNLPGPLTGAKVVDGGLPVVACGSPGNCVAGDWSYLGKQTAAFVVAQVNGVWGKARDVPGVPDAISCPAAGDCAAVLGRDVVSEKNGAWGKAIPVPGLAALSHGEPIDSESISCPSPGNCGAAGSYYSFALADKAFVVTERHGVWGKVEPVRDPPRTGFNVSQESCPAAGNCVAAGYGYSMNSNGDESLVVTQAHGRWGQAEVLPGSAKHGGGGIDVLACPAVGACAAQGVFYVGMQSEPFVATEKDGTWHTAQTVAGFSPSDAGQWWLGCAAAGRCVLAGDVRTDNHYQSATAELAGGRWGRAEILPGILTLEGKQGSGIDSVSCPLHTGCTVLGDFGAHMFAAAQR
ncbi:MAG TPA: hypothetical protein VMR14_21490 [Streptosporangiaceae bacterium]|nr:hypothetical protein [Streptosporangiaceae bacterium]